MPPLGMKKYPCAIACWRPPLDADMRLMDARALVVPVLTRLHARAGRRVAWFRRTRCDADLLDLKQGLLTPVHVAGQGRAADLAFSERVTDAAANRFEHADRARRIATKLESRAQALTMPATAKVAASRLGKRGRIEREAAKLQQCSMPQRPFASVLGYACS